MHTLLVMVEKFIQNQSNQSTYFTHPMKQFCHSLSTLIKFHQKSTIKNLKLKCFFNSYRNFVFLLLSSFHLHITVIVIVFVISSRYKIYENVFIVFKKCTQLK